MGTILDLTAGPVEVEDTGGDGPVVVMLHGVMMDHRQWSGVVEQLRPTYRCVYPHCLLVPTGVPCVRRRTCHCEVKHAW